MDLLSDAVIDIFCDDDGVGRLELFVEERVEVVSLDSDVEDVLDTSVVEFVLVNVTVIASDDDGVGDPPEYLSADVPIDFVSVTSDVSEYECLGDTDCEDVKVRDPEKVNVLVFLERETDRVRLTGADRVGSA